MCFSFLDVELGCDFKYETLTPSWLSVAKGSEIRGLLRRILTVQECRLSGVDSLPLRQLLYSNVDSNVNSNVDSNVNSNVNSNMNSNVNSFAPMSALLHRCQLFCSNVDSCTSASTLALQCQLQRQLFGSDVDFCALCQLWG